MNRALHTAAQDIATHVAAMEARRGAPFANAFNNQLAGGLATPRTVGIPVTLLHALSRAVATDGTPPDELRRRFDEQSGRARADLLATVAGVALIAWALAWLGPKLDAPADQPAPTTSAVVSHG